MNPSILVDKLVERGLVTHAVVDEVMASDRHTGKAVEIALMDEGLVAEEELLQLMSELFQIPFNHIGPDDLDNKLASKVPTRLLRNFHVYPLQRKGEVQPIATLDPFDVTAADIFRQVTGRDTRYVLVPRAEIEAAIDGKLVGSEEFESLVEMVPSVPGLEVDEILDERQELLSENSSPIIKLVNSILREAIRMKASDIHVEPQEKDFRVRYRVDGLLKTIAVLPKRVEKTCITRIKILSEIDISDTRKAHDGRISLTVMTGKVHLRVSTVPTPYGEKVVLRILDQGATQLELTQLGFDGADLNTFHTHLAASTGMVLITGPTGSGKTSTLYASLRLLNDPAINIATVEDPIEYQLPGLTQVQVNAKAGLTFASTLRAFLRQDPDVIMVGEIRDLETATTAVQAAQSGHLVLSTLHTNNAPGTLARLVLLGVQPHQVASGLLCVVAQRLVRRICRKCKKATTIKPEQSTMLGLAVEQRLPRKLFMGQGCSYCGGTGYNGRLGLYEILTITSGIRQQIVLSAKEESLWKVAREEGLKTLLEDGLNKVEKGITTLEEVLRVVTIRRISGSEGASGTSVPTVVPPSESVKTIEEVMTKNVVTLHPKASLAEAVRLMRFRGISGCPVVNHKGVVIGLVSQSDLCSTLDEDSEKKGRTVEEIMSPQVVSSPPYETLKEAAQKMWRYKIHRLIVLHEGELVGVLTPFDLLLHSRMFKEE
jgi:type IV pilus assembly protein PilB